MDFFQRVGNFFTGSGWVSDDEKKRKQQQAAQQQAQKQKTQPQLNSKPVQNTQQQTATNAVLNNGVFNIKTPQQKQAEQLEAQQAELNRAAQANLASKRAKLQKADEASMKNSSLLEKIIYNVTGQQDLNKRAQIAARNQAVSQYDAKNNYNNDAKVAQYRAVTAAQAAQNSKSAQEAIENTKKAVDVARLVPGAGIGEWGANMIRQGTGSMTTDDLIAEQLGMSKADIAKLSDEDKAKYAKIAQAGLGIGAIADAVPIGMGVGQIAKSGTKNLAKKSMKTLLADLITKRGLATTAANAGVGGAISSGLSYGASRAMGANNEQALQSAAGSFLPGVAGGLIGRPIDAAQDSVRNAPNAARSAIVNSAVKRGIANTTDDDIRRGLEEIDVRNNGTTREEPDVNPVETSKAEPTVPKTAEEAQTNINNLNETRTTVEQNAIQETNRIVNDKSLSTQEKAEQVQAIKDRVKQVTDQIDSNIKDSQDVIDAHQATLEQGQEQRASTNEEVQQEQAQAANPAPAAVGDTEQKSVANTEVDSNNAYDDIGNKNTWDYTDETLGMSGVDNVNEGTKQSKLSTLVHRAAGGDIRDAYKAGVDKVRDALADKYYEAAKGNIVQSAGTRTATLFSSNAAVKEGIRSIIRVRNDAQSAAGDAVKRLAKVLKSQVDEIGNPAETNMRLDQVFETPEFLARKYGEGTPSLTATDLTPQEQSIYNTLIRINQIRNEALFRQGKISRAEYDMFKDGTHSPRIYDFESEGLGVKGNKLIDTTSTRERKDLDKISDETFAKLIDSPIQRMLIRYEMALRSQASHDALGALSEAGMVGNVAPNNQFSRLDGAKWGNYQGKYVYNPLKGQLDNSIVMNTKAGRDYNSLLDAWRYSGLGTADRFLKKTKTVYSPGTFIGNVFSNPMLFNRAAGVNPISQSVRMAQAGVDLANHRSGRTFNPIIYEAQKYGVFSSDTGKQITGENRPELSVTKKNQLRNMPDKAYGGVDDAAKLAIYKTLRQRGIDPETAARRVSQATQDYNNAGRLVKTLADMPVLGKPFARFAPELVRLVKNNVLYNPVGMVSGVALLAVLQNQLQEMSGETDEERDARQGAVGQTKIPYTAWIDKLVGGKGRDISLNFANGDTAVNVARAIGLNFPVEPNSNPETAIINAIVPWANPTRQNAQGDTVFAPEELFSSLLLSPIARQVANRDFMGRTITDPDNKVYYEGVNGKNVTKYSDELSQGDQNMNRLQSLIMSYTPLANEANAVTSAVQGNKDYYGKTRSVPEAIARAFGIKAESNTKDVREKRVETAKYFDESLPAVNDFLRENPDLAETYWTLKDPSRNRITNQKTSNLITPEKWDLINSDTSGRLFNFLKEQAVANNKADGRPVDPVYTLPADQAKYVTELRSRPTGDDTEAQEILRATTDWYPAYEDQYYAYIDANQKYWDGQESFEGAADDNPRVAAYNEVSKNRAEQPDIVKQYYQIKNENPDNAKAFYKLNKAALSSAFNDYAKSRLERINKMRAIEGYQPISLETFTNDTFGFNAKSSGYGSSGSGYGSSSRTTNNLGTLSNLIASVNRLKEIQPETAPALNTLLAKLLAGSSSGGASVKLGASATGNPRTD